MRRVWLLAALLTAGCAATYPICRLPAPTPWFSHEKATDEIVYEASRDLVRALEASPIVSSLARFEWVDAPDGWRAVERETAIAIVRSELEATGRVLFVESAASWRVRVRAVWDLDFGNDCREIEPGVLALTQSKRRRLFVSCSLEVVDESGERRAQGHADDGFEELGPDVFER